MIGDIPNVDEVGRAVARRHHHVAVQGVGGLGVDRSAMRCRVAASLSCRAICCAMASGGPTMGLRTTRVQGSAEDAVRPWLRSWLAEPHPARLRPYAADIATAISAEIGLRRFTRSPFFRSASRHAELWFSYGKGCGQVNGLAPAWICAGGVG